MDAIETLLAIEELRALKARYFRCVDTKDWAGFAELFAEDALFDISDDVPGGITHGRDAVVDQYERQFDGKVGGYELDDLEVQAGRGGRAAGTYHVDRDEGDPYDGSIVFGVVRERGEPRIALIAFTPSSS